MIGFRVLPRVTFQVASFLHHELPIRLAHRVRDLESLPDMLAQKSVQQVRIEAWEVQVEIGVLSIRACVASFDNASLCQPFL